MKKYAGHGQGQGSNSTIMLNEKDAEKYAKEYMPKEYLGKALAEIKNRSHTSDSSHAGGANSTSSIELLDTGAQKSSADSQSQQSQSGKYQQYMKKYAGQYTGGSQGGSQSGNYQQYMKKYAGQYMGGSQGGSQSGNYQQYMKKYAGNGQGQGSNSTIELNEQDAEKYAKEYVPKEYQAKALAKIENRSHTSDSGPADSATEDKIEQATSADKHNDVELLALPEHKMRRLFLRGQANPDSESDMAEPAPATKSSVASLAACALFGVALACIVFFVKRISRKVKLPEELLG
jgi:hypothetical protein